MSVSPFWGLSLIFPRALVHEALEGSPLHGLLEDVALAVGCLHAVVVGADAPPVAGLEYLCPAPRRRLALAHVLHAPPSSHQRGRWYGSVTTAQRALAGAAMRRERISACHGAA